MSFLPMSTVPSCSHALDTARLVLDAPAAFSCLAGTFGETGAAGIILLLTAGAAYIMQRIIL